MEAFFSFVLQLFIWILVSTRQHKPTALQKNENQPGPTVKTWSILKINGILARFAALRHGGLQALWGSMVMTWAERWGWLGLELMHGPLCFMLWLEDRQHQTEKARRLRFFRKACAPMEFCLVATRLTSSQGPYVAGVRKASCKTFIFSITVIDSLQAHFWGITAEWPACLASVWSFLLWTFSCLWKDMHQTLRKKHVPQNMFCTHPDKEVQKKQKPAQCKIQEPWLKLNRFWLSCSPINSQPTTILKSLSCTFISSHNVAGKLVCTPGIGTKKL